MECNLLLEPPSRFTCNGSNSFPYVSKFNGIVTYSPREKFRAREKFWALLQKYTWQAQKALSLEFQSFPVKYTPFSSKISKTIIQHLLKSDYSVLKKSFLLFGKVPFCQCHCFRCMCQHPCTGIFRHILHWGWYMFQNLQFVKAKKTVFEKFKKRNDYAIN